MKYVIQSIFSLFIFANFALAVDVCTYESEEQSQRAYSRLQERLSCSEEEPDCSVCENTYLLEPPFFVTAGAGGRIYQEMVSEGEQGSVISHVPKGSIVNLAVDRSILQDPNIRRVPVTVASVPDGNIEEDLQRASNSNDSKTNLRRLASGYREWRRSEEGSEGLVRIDGLVPAGEFQFVINSNTPLFDIAPDRRGEYIQDTFTNAAISLMESLGVREPQEREEKNYGSHFGAVLTLQTLDITNPENPSDSCQKYRVNRCCSSRGCNDAYQFNVEVESSNGSLERDFDVSINNDQFMCLFAQDARPIPHDDMQAFRALANASSLAGTDIELVELNGRTMVKLPYNTSSGMSPFGFSHYNPDDHVNSDAIVDITTACALTKVLEKFGEIICPNSEPGCLPQVGDMYHHRDYGDHRTHGSGYCIDIRNFRNGVNETARYAGVLYTEVSNDSPRGYDRTKTAELMALLIRAGATEILTEDTKIINAFEDSPAVSGSFDSETSSFPRDVNGHDRHFHFCLEPDNPLVQRTCSEGMPDDTEPTFAGFNFDSGIFVPVPSLKPEPVELGFDPGVYNEASRRLSLGAIGFPAEFEPEDAMADTEFELSRRNYSPYPEQRLGTVVVRPSIAQEFGNDLPEARPDLAQMSRYISGVEQRPCQFSEVRESELRDELERDCWRQRREIANRAPSSEETTEDLEYQLKTNVNTQPMAPLRLATIVVEESADPAMREATRGPCSLQEFMNRNIFQLADWRVEGACGE